MRQLEFEFICINCKNLITNQETAIYATGEGFVCNQCIEMWLGGNEENGPTT